MPSLPPIKILPHLKRKTSRFSEDVEQPPAERGRQRIRAALAAAALMVALFAGYPLLMRENQPAATLSPNLVTPCDRLAAHPADTQKLAVGVSQDQLDLHAARTACIQALADQPENGRILYQLSRTYMSTGAGDDDSGLVYLRKSAEHGYAQGQYTLAMLLLRQPDDDAHRCDGGKLLVAAARQRHFSSKIMLGQYWLDGKFQGCALPIAHTEIGDMISQAGDMASTSEEKTELAKLAARWKNAK